VDAPFVYLDKNYVRIFGGIGKALEAASALPGYLKIIQLKGETGSPAAETREAVSSGADVVMVDTGKFEDVAEVSRTLEELGARGKIKVAFAKDLRFEDLPRCAEQGIDLLCIGKEIIDAPLMDMKLDIIAVKEADGGA
jgi:nicotinate-nucleotide pyrophosphorylase (carboxylating)